MLKESGYDGSKVVILHPTDLATLGSLASVTAQALKGIGMNVEIQSKYDRVWGADQTLFGVALFDNSFGQFSQYVYWGQKWDLHPNVYAKVTAGLLHGYHGKYRDKIPFNRAEIAPAIIPAIGVRFGNLSIEGILLGGAAMQFAVGYTFR